MTQIRNNFIYPNIKHEQRVFGATHSIGTVINESGDWRQSLPIPEEQRINGIESSACYVYAQLITIASILEKQYGVLDSDFAERFNALLSNGMSYGGDPIAGAESIRTDGVVPQKDMPFSNDIQSWNDFHSWQGVVEGTLRALGQDFLKKYKVNYDIVIERDWPIEAKYNRLTEALLKSPVPISVYGKVDSNGNYVPKESWMSDTHLLTATFIDESGIIHVRDTYKPFDKTLPKGYNPDFGIMWGVTKIEDKKKDPLWYRIYVWLFRERLIIRDFKKFWINKQNAEK